MRFYFTLGSNTEGSNVPSSEPQTKARGAIYIFLFLYLQHSYVHSNEQTRRGSVGSECVAEPGVKGRGKLRDSLLSLPRRASEGSHLD